MKKLELKNDCYFVYDESGDIIFQSALRKDLNNFLKNECMCLDFENACLNKDDDLHNMPGKTFKGYWRMYFRNGFWDGRWFDADNGNMTDFQIAALNNIIKYIRERWPKGCSYTMQGDIEQNFIDCKLGDYRYFVKPMGLDNFIIMLDVEYGNEDYPVRIYVYE